MESSGRTDTGRVRTHNEDAFFADNESGVFIVSDGMGGMNAGEVASKTVVEALSELLKKNVHAYEKMSVGEIEGHLRQSLMDLSNYVRSETENQFGLSGMGATVVTAVTRGRRAIVANVGDSRAYLIRGGSIKLLTRDHTMVQALVDAGELSPDDARQHPGRGQLTGYIGMTGSPEPIVRDFEMEKDDVLLLCSDGLTNMLNESVILDIVSKAPSVDECCASLVGVANEAGGRDNITVILIRNS